MTDEPVAILDRIHYFRQCFVEVYENVISAYTRYGDGTFVSASPILEGPKANEQSDLALALGYSSVWGMVREHELAHTFLAERLEFDVSPVLWDVAHNLVREDGTWPGQELWAGEERDVIAFQAYLNGTTTVDTQDAFGYLTQRGVDVDQARFEFVQRFR